MMICFLCLLRRLAELENEAGGLLLLASRNEKKLGGGDLDWVDADSDWRGKVGNRRNLSCCFDCASASER